MTPKPQTPLVKLLPLICLCLAPLVAQVHAQTRNPARRQGQRTPPARKVEQDKVGAQTTQPQARQVTPSIRITWKGEPGVERYRLQVSRDETFSDIVFDRAVTGREYEVTGLAAGNYYWRVAPAIDETGEYTTPMPVRIDEKAPVVAVASTGVLTPPEHVGWRTATGEVMQPQAAQLRTGGGFDLVAVNSDGTVYALDGTNGVALWTARYRPNARRGDAVARMNPLVPLVLRSKGGMRVVVGVEGGVRALRADEGTEVWRTKLNGRAAGGVVTDITGDGTPEVVVATEGPSMLYMLDGETGRIVTETATEAAPVGAPYAFKLGDATVVALAQAGGRLDMRGADGKVLRGVKLNTEITTPPHVVTNGRDRILMVGTEQGIVAFDATELKALGRVSTEDDMPRGKLVSTDVDGDGTPEIAVVTKRGRVALINTTDGRVRWFAEGATDAASAAFADVNGDGVLDVLVPAGSTFALGFSGRDGLLLWRAEEPGKQATGTPGGNFMRALTVAPSPDGGLVIGSDPSRVNLRAVGLPKGAVKTASNEP